MIESKNRVRVTISEEIMLARLAQSEQMRAFFIEMWKQNPALAKQGGVKVRNLLTQLERVDLEAKPFSPMGKGREGGKQRGISLIELIMFIVIVSVALAGILLVMNVTTKSSADPLIHKQALAIAESLLEEIELQDFISVSGVTNAVTQANRAAEYHIVGDYNAFATTGIFPVSGVAAIAGLENYNTNVTVANAALGGIAAGSAVQITVTVTDPQGNDIQISGYRTAY